MGKKKPRRNSGEGALSITSMMDMMTIILVFLLKNFSSQDISVKSSADLQLPLSSALKAPKTAVNVVVSRVDVIVDGVKVMDLESTTDEVTGQATVMVPEGELKGQLITTLYEKLLDKAEQAKDIGARAGGGEFDFKGQVLMQCDKRLPFSVIRQVMYTAGQAQFSEFRFVVIKTRE